MQLQQLWSTCVLQALAYSPQEVYVNMQDLKPQLLSDFEGEVQGMPTTEGGGRLQSGGGQHNLAHHEVVPRQMSQRNFMPLTKSFGGHTIFQKPDRRESCH